MHLSADRMKNAVYNVVPSVLFSSKCMRGPLVVEAPLLLARIYEVVCKVILF